MISFSSSYSQNFDSLASSGTALSWNNDGTLPGWFLFRQPTNGPVAITSYVADSGSGNSGSFYSYGSTNASDRALGGLGSGGNYFGSPAAGALAGWIALALTNSSGTTINALDLSFTIDQPKFPQRRRQVAVFMAWMAELYQGKTLQFIQLLPGGGGQWQLQLAAGGLQQCRRLISLLPVGIYGGWQRFCWAIGHGGGAFQ